MPAILRKGMALAVVLAAWSFDQVAFAENNPCARRTTPGGADQTLPCFNTTSRPEQPT